MPPTDPLANDPSKINSTIGSSATGFPQNGAGLHNGWQEDREILKTDTVYFDYDSSTIKGSEKSKIEAVAAYLKQNGSAAVKVEGNCDERGTEEYNRALGERRALAIREYLINSGLTPTTVDPVSYGEDKPAVQGHNEAAGKKKPKPGIPRADRGRPGAVPNAGKKLTGSMDDMARQMAAEGKLG